MTIKDDLQKLNPEQSAFVKDYVEKAKERALVRALKHRGVVLSLKFKQSDIETWHTAAEEADLSLTAWIEKHLNSAAKRVYVKKQTTPPKKRKKTSIKSPDHRGAVLSLRFKQSDIETWRLASQAACEYLTNWVEKVLNKAAEKAQA